MTVTTAVAGSNLRCTAMDDVTWSVVVVATMFGGIVGLIHNLSSGEEGSIGRWWRDTFSDDTPPSKRPNRPKR